MSRDAAHPRLLCLGIIAVLFSGCALSSSERKCCRCPLTPVGTVETGGPFAVARTLPIPASGLTLSDAVESSLRPGIVSQAAPIPGRFDSTSLVSSEAVEDQQKSVIAILQSSINPAHDRTQEIQDLTNEIIFVLIGDHSESTATNEFEAVVKKAITAAADDGAFKPAVASDRSQNTKVRLRKTQLYHEILINFIYSGFVDAGTPSDEQLKQSRDRIAGLFNVPTLDQQYESLLQKLMNARDRSGVFALTGVSRNEALMQLLVSSAEEKPVSAPVAMITPTSERSIADELAVVLLRSTGRRFIIPLQFVRTFRPGDIRLEPGDQIQIVPFPQLDTAAELPVDGDVVAVTSWYAKEGLVRPLAENTSASLWDHVNEIDDGNFDTVILRRLSRLQGIDEFILPSDDAARLSKIPMSNLDLIHLDSFGMNPLTQRMPASPTRDRCEHCGLFTRAAAMYPDSIAGPDQQLKRYSGIGVQETVNSTGKVLHDTAAVGGNVLMNASAGFTSQFR